MKTSDFYYCLPNELIAQHPIDQRDHSRLMVLNKNNGSVIHDKFYNILNYLSSGDCLILNNSRVLPARLYGQKAGSGSKIEFLLLKPHGNDIWDVLVKPGKKAKIDTEFEFSELLKAKVLSISEDGTRTVKFDYQGNFFDVIDQIGLMPLPPYIKEKLNDKERYQTVYSKDIGSVAAPTAGLHFTKELIEQIKTKGVNIGFVTLHVGLGTFRPVKVDNIDEHKMHSESYYIPKETAELINNTKKNNHKVIAVGTTSCRTLESAYCKYNKICECSGTTDIFIYPGYSFKCIDSLITNFHLPESTLIMLVSAFAGYESTMNAYKTAVNEKYRFFSFGDAMLIQ